MAHSRQGNGHRPGDRRIGDLLSHFADDAFTLVGQEIELARAEVSLQVRRALAGAAMFAAAAVLALAGVGALTAAAILGLGEVVEAWLAAVIVGGGLLVIALAAALTGRERLDEVAPPVPHRAVDSVRRDALAVARGMEQGHREARRERETEGANHG